MSDSLLSQKIEALNTLLARMNGVPVLVIGDIMLDRFISGSVERISPESPVPVLNVRREDSMPGGCGNALASLRGLKIDARIVAITGHDEPANTLSAMLENMDVDTSGLITDPSRPTTIKTRYMAGHQQLLRSDYEDARAVDADIQKKLLAAIEKAMTGVKAIILSDYGKGVLTKELVSAVMASARAQGIPVIVDPKRPDFSHYAGATAITPNKKELALATGDMPTASDADIEAACRKITAECHIDCVIATRSADGLSVVHRAGGAEPLHLKSQAREVFDVSGAGDVVIATIAATLAAGGNLSEAAHLANIAGGIAVAKVGTSPIRTSELQAALNEDEAGRQILSTREGGAGLAHQAPLCDWDEAAEYIGRWRRRGLKIGFTNGCFDILHAGHVAYLNETRKHCDRLILGLNTDESVRALKGESRPVHNESSRAAVMGALACVDMVVLFGGQTKTDDQTANALLARLQPDIYFKGGDYSEDAVPEAPIVRSYGGQVKILGLIPGLSTTNAIKKLAGEAA